MTQSSAQEAAILPDPALESKTFKKILMDQVHAGGGIKAVGDLTMAPLALFRDLEQCDSGLK